MVLSRAIVVLSCAVLAATAAMAVIHSRHSSRLMFAELQELKAERDALDVEWGKLLLEEGAWAQHRRIERTARTRLGMALPLPEQIAIVYAEADKSK